MNKKAIGEIIRNRRKELNLTQEKLSCGICGIASLSRIECGDIGNNWDMVFMILERLGLSNIAVHEIECAEDYIVEQRLNEVNRLAILDKYDKSWEIIDEISGIYDKLSNFNKQHFDLVSTHLLEQENKISKEEALLSYEKTLRISWKNYSVDNLPLLLTSQEIVLLNCIARTYAKLGDKELCVKILYHVKGCIELHEINETEKAINLPLILYNLSKYLGQLGRYDECIEACKQGIALERNSGRCWHMPETMYNYAWALVKRARPEDMNLAERIARRAYFLSTIVHGYPSLTEHIKSFINENFSDD